MTGLREELIVIKPNEDALSRSLAQGDETARLLGGMSKISEPEKGVLVSEAASILGQGVALNAAGENATGLVVGYVQSGKTASFTTVTALARDNGFRLVIVITGISTSLLGQSGSRLSRDLQIDFGDYRKWRLMENPAVRGKTKASTLVTVDEVQDTLDIWDDPIAADGQKQALLITVMKNHRHLRNLTALLRELRLDTVRALVIDDEADQAGLNTKAKEDEQSATYRHILALRDALPTHTYLQYTATPQAPLLISLEDALSPDFVRVLNPGADYVGGLQFFVQRSELVRVIPAQDIISQNNPLSSPPDSFLEALRIFFLGVAAAIASDDTKGNRSMLVHPSQGTLHHKVYLQWIRSVKQHWISTLQLGQEESERRELLHEFAASYSDLQRTVGPQLPEFDVVVSRLPLALKQTRELEVNASTGGHTPEVRWRDAYSHILVGGQAMERGFTVEGLTVTYMPRGTGVGHADTIQQRARFLGYKRSYLGFCRVFLEEDTKSAFRSYVRHEERMREDLVKESTKRRPLSEWKRRFLLDPALKATRAEVLNLPNMRVNFASEWFQPRVVLDTEPHREANRTLLKAFENSIDPKPDATLGDETNLVAYHVPVEKVISELLSEYRVGEARDSLRLTALTIQLQAVAEDREFSGCTVYVMGRGRDSGFQRKRPVDSDSYELTTNLFQGRNTSGYPGDTGLPTGAGDVLQLQLHHLSLRDGTGKGDEVAADVGLIAAKIISSDDVILQTG